MRVNPASQIVAAHPNERSLAISHRERTALSRGDLSSFWLSRAQVCDPGARVGVGIWASNDELRAAIMATPQQRCSYWHPSLPNALIWFLRGKLPGTKLPPRSVDDLVRYWTAMGVAANDRLVAHLKRVSPKTVSTDVTKRITLHKVGTALARAHAASVTDDVRASLGRVPGLLSLEQVAAYHHRVFESFGLPPEAFGGTPYAWLPDFIELAWTGGAYGKGSDPYSG